MFSYYFVRDIYLRKKMSFMLSFHFSYVIYLCKQSRQRNNTGNTARSAHRHHSYPSGTGPNKTLRYLGLRLLAEVAEEEGVDLRVLHIRRPVNGLVINCEHDPSGFPNVSKTQGIQTRPTIEAAHFR